MADFFAIKTKVVEILRETLPEFTTTWGFTTRNPPNTWCYIGKLTWPDGDWATNRSREYGVSIPIVLNAIKAHTTSEDGETWLADQVAAVVDAFGPDSDVRSVGVVNWTVVPRDFGSQPHPDGIELQTVLELQVTYRR